MGIEAGSTPLRMDPRNRTPLQKVFPKIIWFVRLEAQHVREFFFRRRLRSYKKWWNHLGKQAAMSEILTGASQEDEFDHSGRIEATWLLETIGRDKVVLDVGCGIGRVEKYLAQDCRELHAVDISSVMLSKAHERLPFRNVSLKLGNGRDLGMYPDAKFDAVFSLLMLQHLEKEDAFLYLLEIHRVLKEAGTFVVQFPNLQSDKHFDSFLMYVFVPKDQRPAARVRGYSRDEIQFILSKVGFRISELRESGADWILVARKQ
jgi:ubiquinone/menaquinone biosynthesis C-methylase UbiE